MDYTRHDTHEGTMTSAIEEKTAHLPSLGFLSLAFASMLASASAQLFFKRKNMGTFIGLWAPSILLLGLYNKVVKMEKTLEDRQLH